MMAAVHRRLGAGRRERPLVLSARLFDLRICPPPAARAAPSRLASGGTRQVPSRASGRDPPAGRARPCADAFPPAPSPG